MHHFQATFHAVFRKYAATIEQGIKQGTGNHSPIVQKIAANMELREIDAASPIAIGIPKEKQTLTT
ncbi:MAG: hypothetical protein CMM07_10320 [Rhodopirellula sp.]|nr:hypothetical protein [Rhodopirellula sp.]